MFDNDNVTTKLNGTSTWWLLFWGEPCLFSRKELAYIYIVNSLQHLYLDISVFFQHDIRRIGYYLGLYSRLNHLSIFTFSVAISIFSNGIQLALHFSLGRLIRRRPEFLTSLFLQRSQFPSKSLSFCARNVWYQSSQTCFNEGSDRKSF